MSVILPPPVTEDERPEAPPFAEAGGRILFREVRAALRGRRLGVAAALACLGPGFILLIRAFDEAAAAEPVRLVQLQVFLFHLLLVPLVAVSLGSGLVHDEAEEGTLTWLFTSPIPKSAVVLGKWAAALLLGWTLLLGSFALTVAVAPVDPEAMGGFTGGAVRALVLGYPAYLAVCAWLGTMFRRGFIPCLIYAFGFELLLNIIPGAMKLFSLGYYLNSIVHPVSPSHDPFEDIFEGVGPVAPRDASLVLAVLAVALIVGALVIAQTKEFHTRNVQA